MNNHVLTIGSIRNGIIANPLNVRLCFGEDPIMLKVIAKKRPVTWPVLLDVSDLKTALILWTDVQITIGIRFI